MSIKLGVLEHWFDDEPVVPGKTLDERLRNLEAAGYQGIQLSGVSRRESMESIRKSLAASNIKLLIHGRGGRILGSY